MSSLLSLAVVLLGAASAFAAPLASTACVTFQSGVLTTEQLTYTNGTFNGVYKPLAFNYLGELSYFESTPHPTIYAEFQTCTPNYAGNDNRLMSKIGRIYIPATKQCLGVDNASSPSGPYYITAQSCPNSAAGEMETAKSIPFNFVNSYGFTTWVGSSTQNLTQLQGGCSGGAFAYLADPSGTRAPYHNVNENYRIELVCIRGGQLTGTLWLDYDYDA